MEKYITIQNNTQNDNIKFGKYYNLVHNKHIASYSQTGADNIVSNTVETYRSIQIQLKDITKNNNVLLVGKVQSGKTSNLELFTALAFDNGYNVLVIYGGYDKTLLKQTTDRFKSTFNATGDISYDDDSPAIYTTDDSDQILSIDDEIMTDLLDNNKPIIFVSMKRPAAMNKINSLFKRLDKSMFKAFIIDDEGDQASLNNAKNKVEDASSTYQQIIDMKKLLDDPLYLSVTATPQANIFLDELSALRPDSIRLIHPGRGYNGAEEYHLSENDIITIVPDSDHDDLENGNIPSSLWDAVKYFIVASAIKRKRATSNSGRYSDMIVHDFREVSQHSNIYTAIDNYISCIKTSFEYGDDDIKAYMDDFEECFNRFISKEIQESLSFKDIKDEISTVVKKTKVILKNGQGKLTQGNEKLKWHKIYVGGDLIQRGLTFSNLITTYFTRWAKSGGNMDTNLQRARWFGYRNKYLDLCKIFTTNEIAQEFTALAEIEDDLWEQFQDVENGNLKIDDILVQSDNTKQSPTSKQRVKYTKVSFKSRWIKQKFIVTDESKILENNKIIDSLFNNTEWNDTTFGSRNDSVTAQYAYFDAETLRKLITVIHDTFDYEPFQKKALSNLLGQDNIPIIRMGADKKPRYRTLYPQDMKIKALQQGANSTDEDKITYEGDSSVIIDKNKINIQIYKITPGINKESPMDSKTQYMFAIYIPKEKTYFVKEN